MTSVHNHDQEARLTVNAGSQRQGFGALDQARRRRLAVAALCAGGGLIALVAGWIGVSGTRVISDQLAYIASGGLFGLCFVAFAGALLVADLLVEQDQNINDLRGEIFALREDLSILSISGAAGSLNGQTSSIGGRTSGPVEPDPSILVRLSGSMKVHRSSCAIVAGKPQRELVTADQARSLALTPCRSCEPEVADTDLATLTTAFPVR
jgi:hypothetical protein